MKPLLFAFALTAPHLWSAGGVPAITPVALYAQFDSVPLPALVSAMQTEVNSIMAPMGLSFDWRDLNFQGDRVSVELAVINFRGHCDVLGAVPHNASPGALGWTHTAGGAIIPFADVDCDAVRAFLESDLWFLRAPARAAALGRALGRVLAHELYHIFANTRHHGADGVAREAFSAKDLLAPTFRFEERESILLAHSAARSAVANATDESGADHGQR